MTVLKRVSAKEMKKRTGFGKALGYSFPEEDEILIRDDLPKDLEHEVIAHEEEHVAKGEEGPFLEFLIPAAVSLFGASKQSKAAKRATAAQSQAADQEIAYAKETRDLLRQDQAPYREAGYKALDALMSMTGLGGGAKRSPFSALGPAARGIGTVVNRGVDQIRSGRGFSSAFSRIRPRYAGGGMDGDMYNINELGPENVYSGGAISRNPNPMTIDGQTGYVEPNIQGRALGGSTYPIHYNTGEYRGVRPDFGGNIKLAEGNNSPFLPNRHQGGATPSGNTANSTAINPQTGYPNENPGGVEGGYNFMTDPGYQFRFSEGMRALDRGAAARGGLLSGGYGRKAIRYGQGFASNEYTNVYNRIANIAGLGQTANQQGMYGALVTSGQVGNALSNQGAARASGYAANANIWGDAAQGIAKLPWDQFKWPWGSGGPGSGQGTTGAGVFTENY